MATRRRKSKPSLSDLIYKHSPIKRGVLVVKDEDKPHSNFDKIMSKLYLGNVKASRDKEFFSSKKIKAVLNCSKDIPNTFDCAKDIEYMRIPIDDSLKEIDFEKAFLFMPSAIEFIYKHVVLEKHNVLVHCWAGRQRSAIMIAAFLMEKMKMTPIQACKFLVDHRSETFHFGKSLNFEVSLEKYYKELQKYKHCKK